MVSPIYGDPSYLILESVSPDAIRVRIEIIDFKRFVERILNIKDGGSLILEKRVSGRGVDIILSNKDSGSVKTLGD